MPETIKECWTCKYHKIGGDTFLGFCSYFETLNKEKKEIPPDIVDTGCKFWKDKYDIKVTQGNLF